MSVNQRQENRLRSYLYELFKYEYTTAATNELVQEFRKLPVESRKAYPSHLFKIVKEHRRVHKKKYSMLELLRNLSQHLD